MLLINAWHEKWSCSTSDSVCWWRGALQILLNLFLLSIQCLLYDSICTDMHSAFPELARACARARAHTHTHTHIHTHAGQLPQSCATLDLDALSRRVEQKNKKVPLTQREAESAHRLLGLRMAAVSTFLGCVCARVD
eukprot:1157733-Pelagomonas_calceolata.AAC.8